MISFSAKKQEASSSLGEETHTTSSHERLKLEQKVSRRWFQLEARPSLKDEARTAAVSVAEAISKDIIASSIETSANSSSGNITARRDSNNDDNDNTIDPLSSSATTIRANNLDMSAATTSTMANSSARNLRFPPFEIDRYRDHSLKGDGRGDVISIVSTESYSDYGSTSSSVVLDDDSILLGRRFRGNKQQQGTITTNNENNKNNKKNNGRMTLGNFIEKTKKTKKAKKKHLRVTFQEDEQQHDDDYHIIRSRGKENKVDKQQQGTQQKEKENNNKTGKTKKKKQQQQIMKNLLNDVQNNNHQQQAWMCGVCGKMFSSFRAADRHEYQHIEQVIAKLGYGRIATAADNNNDDDNNDDVDNRDLLPKSNDTIKSSSSGATMDDNDDSSSSDIMSSRSLQQQQRHDSTRSNGRGGRRSHKKTLVPISMDDIPEGTLVPSPLYNGNDEHKHNTTAAAAADDGATTSTATTDYPVLGLDTATTAATTTGLVSSTGEQTNNNNNNINGNNSDDNDDDVLLLPNSLQQLNLADEALVEVCSKASGLILTPEEVEAERELELLAGDKTYYDSIAQKQQQLRNDNHNNQRYQKLKWEGKSTFTRIQNKFVDAYQIMKEGDPQFGGAYYLQHDEYDNNNYKRRRRRRNRLNSDDDNNRNDGDLDDDTPMQHSNQTLYVNVMVRNSIQVINNELERLAKSRWEGTIDKDNNDDNNNSQQLDVVAGGGGNRFENLRAFAHSNLVKLAGLALASDFTPRRIAVQLSNDLYRLLRPRMKRRGVTIETEIEYRVGPYFVLSVNIRSIDWGTLLKITHKEVVARNKRWIANQLGARTKKKNDDHPHNKKDNRSRKNSIDKSSRGGNANNENATTSAAGGNNNNSNNNNENSHDTLLHGNNNPQQQQQSQEQQQQQQQQRRRRNTEESMDNDDDEKDWRSRYARSMAAIIASFRMTNFDVIAQILSLLYYAHWIVHIPICVFWYYTFLGPTIRSFILNTVADEIFSYVEEKGMEMEIEVRKAAMQADFMLSALRELRADDREKKKKRNDDDDAPDAKASIIGPLLGPAIKQDKGGVDGDASSFPMPDNLEFVGLELDLPVGYRRLRWAMLCSESEFVKEAIMRSGAKYDNITFGAWSKHEELIGQVTLPDGVKHEDFIGAEKEVSYLMPKSAFVAANMCHETQILEAYNDHGFCLKKKALTPDVPYGSTFVAWTQYVVINTGNDSCRLICSVEAEFPNGPPLVSRQIKSGMRAGTAELFVLMGETISNYADSYP